jgi:hypothetical protein
VVRKMKTKRMILGITSRVRGPNSLKIWRLLQKRVKNHPLVPLKKTLICQRVTRMVKLKMKMSNINLLKKMKLKRLKARVKTLQAKRSLKLKKNPSIPRLRSHFKSLRKNKN